MRLAADFKAAFRNVRRGGRRSVTVVMILAVALGVVTAIFSIAHAVLIRPLPVADPDRVVLLWGRDDVRSQQVVEVSLLDQRAWLAGQKSFAAIELFGSVTGGSCLLGTVSVLSAYLPARRAARIDPVAALRRE